MIGLGGDIARHTCSRAGCRATATARVEWRNPRIHGPERTKVWLACDDHVDYLSGFLAARDFPVMVRSLDVAADDPSEAAVES